jgi:hypothetical protein
MTNSTFRIQIFLVVSLLSFLITPAELLAQKPKKTTGKELVYFEINQAELMRIMEKDGYAVSKAPVGENIHWRIDGRVTLLLISENKLSVQFYVGITDSNGNLERVNNWNTNRRYSRSYMDRDGDPVLELDLDITGGVTEARIRDFLLTCRLSLTQWMDEVVR